MLYYLSVEKAKTIHSIDWGCLIIYSCSRSCSPSTPDEWVEEFLARQMLEKLM